METKPISFGKIKINTDPPSKKPTADTKLYK